MSDEMSAAEFQAKYGGKARPKPKPEANGGITGSRVEPPQDHETHVSILYEDEGDASVKGRIMSIESLEALLEQLQRSPRPREVRGKIEVLR